MKKHWIYTRLILMAASAGSAWQFVSMPGDFSHPSISFFFIIVAFMAIGVAFTLGIQKVNPLSSAEWQRPSWSSSPFSFRQPLKSFHTAGWCFIAAGLGSFILGMSRSPLNWAWELPLSAGIGTLIGVRLMYSNHSGENSAYKKINIDKLK